MSDKSTKAWWKVKTGHPNDERGSRPVYLGTYYGHVDEIALRLANKQQGFWCDGKLTFIRVKEPKQPKLPRKPTKPTVNVVIDEIKWKNGPELLERNKQFFKDRPVEVEDCSQFGAVTLKIKS